MLTVTDLILQNQGAGWGRAFDASPDTLLYVKANEEAGIINCYFQPEGYWIKALSIPEKRRLGVVFDNKNYLHGFLLGAIQTKGWCYLPCKPQRQIGALNWYPPIAITPGDTLKLCQKNINNIKRYFGYQNAMQNSNPTP